MTPTLSRIKRSSYHLEPDSHTDLVFATCIVMTEINHWLSASMLDINAEFR